MNITIIIKKNYFAIAGVKDELIYSSTDEGSEEDEDTWMPRPLSLPSEDPTEGREGFVTKSIARKRRRRRSRGVSVALDERYCRRSSTAA